MSLEQAHVRDPREVSRLFGRIAPRYDFMNRLMSLGQDLAWREGLLDLVQDLPGPMLDLCAGTGDVALRAAARRRGTTVIALDGSEGMMRVGKGKQGVPEIAGWVQADAVSLPVRDGSLGSITVAFGVRNVARQAELFVELLRVLRPGGRLAILDIFAPRNGILGRCYDAYLRGAVPLIGGLVSGDPPAYRHLAASVKAFGRPEELAVKLGEAGFDCTRARSMNLGTIGLVWGDHP